MTRTPAATTSAPRASLDPLTPVVVAARRTPIGTAGHALAAVPVHELAAAVIGAAVVDAGLDALRLDVDEVVLGNVVGPGGNLARVAALAAGLPEVTPGVTVDRQCGSGQEAVHHAAALVRCGQADVVVAAGAESVSTSPVRTWRDSGVAYERAPFAPPGFADPDMGPAADAVARACGISRERQDAYAARSYELTLAARAAGVYDDELVPVAGVVADERPRRMPPATLARLRPVFTPDGTVTAGSCAGVNDGAAAVVVVAEHVRARLGVPGLALDAWCATAGDPALPGVAPVASVRRLLDRAGVGLADVDVLEVTEAFAAQVLALCDGLGIDLHADPGSSGRGPLVCPDGGAIALGHPYGASGTNLVVRLYSRLVRRGLGERGIAACAIGGGQGLALLAHRTP